MEYQKLRYSIASWYDLSSCVSNNSKKFHIYVEDILDKNKLCGLVISVKHDKYGVLFSHLIDGTGEILSLDGVRAHQFSTEEILKELNKFGFDIRFTPQLHLSESMLDYLSTLQALHYDKLRTISIADKYNYHVDETQFTDYVVAFSPEKLPKWLDNLYTPTKKEFSDAMLSGYACNVSMSPEGVKLDWSWLNYVANISDILDDNALQNYIEGM